MATIYRCDRCKKDFTQRKDIRTIELAHMEQHGSDFTDETDGYTRELCAACFKLVIYVINNLTLKILEPWEMTEYEALRAADRERLIAESKRLRALPNEPTPVSEQIVGEGETQAEKTTVLTDDDIPF